MSESERHGVAVQMFEDHYADVFRYVRARVSTRVEAEDLTADVFCKAVAGLQTYRPLRVSPLPWLYTISAHRVADHYRAARPATADLEVAAQVADTGPNPGDLVVTKEMVGRVWALARRLPPAQGRALWLRYGEELELREIAQRMGRSVEAVKLLVHRAVKALRLAAATEEAPRLAVLPAVANSPRRRARAQVAAAA
ncbi:MAG: RNA polymerase sigma factor [Candidatus Dormibacteria bacterium]